MLDFNKYLLNAILKTDHYRMATIQLTDIGGHFMSDEELKKNITTRLTCIDSYKIDRLKGVLYLRWKTHLSNDEIDDLSTGLIGVRGRKKRK